MILRDNDLNFEIDFVKNHQQIIIENKEFFRNFIYRLNNELLEIEGKITFLDNFEMSKDVWLVKNLFDFDTAFSTTLNTKLNKQLIELAKDELSFSDFNNLTTSINNCAELLKNRFPIHEIGYEKINIDKIIKALKFSFNIDAENYLNGLIRYIEILKEYLDKKLFIFINVSSTLQKEEFIQLCSTFDNLNLLFIENSNSLDSIKTTSILFNGETLYD